MTDVETFMARVVPWPSAGQPGYVSVHYPFLPAGAVRPQYPGRAFTDHQNACRYVRWMINRNIDLFLCMSLQAQAKPGKDKGGRAVLRAVRAEAGAVLLRSFWIDIDIKDGFFRDTDHAVDAFNAWVGRIGLPPPTLYVATGSGGFHPYWVLDEPITKAVWQLIADALAQAVLDPKDGLHPLPAADGTPRKLDVGVIIDASRFLRIPGSYNHKTVPAKPAVLSDPKPYNYTLDQIEQPLARFKGAYPPRVTAAPTVNTLPGSRMSPVFAAVRAKLAALPALNAGVQTWQPTLEDVIDGGCGFAEETKQTGGKGYGENLWFESLKLAFYLQDGEEVAHELSCGYGDYSEAEVDQKYAEIVRSHATGRIGWPQCRTIQSAGASQCASCPHLSKNQSPLNFAMPSAPLAALLPPLPGPLPQPLPGQPVNWGDTPPGYFHDKDGMLYREEDDEDNPGAKVRQYVATCPVFGVWAQRKVAQGTSNAINFKASFWPGRVDDFQATFEELVVPERFSSTLARQGFATTSETGKRMRHFMLSFAEQLRLKKFVAATAVYGWADTDGVTDGFCFDRNRFNGGAAQPVVPSDPEIDQLYRSTGEFQKWQDACHLITDQKRSDLDLIITGAFSAPLVMMTGLSGFVMSCWSPQSGVGKTHAMRVGQSVWGHPTRGLGGLDDTANFIVHRVSMLRHLPFMFDEVKFGTDVERLLRVVLAIGQGKSKGRMTREIKSQPTYDFNTLMVTASNSSLVDHITSQLQTTPAGLQRVFEWRVQPGTSGLGRVNPGDVMQVNGELSNNFGHAGRLWAQFLGKDPDRIKRDMKDAMDAIHKAVAANDDERFWVAAVACNWMATRWLAQQNIVQIDEDRIGNFLIDRFRAQRRSRDDAGVDITAAPTVEKFVGDYLNARRGSMVITDVMWKQVGKPPPGVVTTTLGPQSVDIRNQLSIHYASNDRLLRISVTDFGNWLTKEKHVNKGAILHAVQSTLACTPVLARIGVGTNFKTAREQLLEFDLQKMPTLDFI